MTYFSHTAAIIALCIATIPAGARPGLRITLGKTDTVYTRKIYVVGVTDPESEATVNGKAVKVYKTGAFGCQITLNEGGNRIGVKVTDRTSGVASEEWDVFYSRKKPSNDAPQQKRETCTPKELFVATGPDAYLQASETGDRLGASKLGFIDEGIVLKVVGETSSVWKVRLSSNRYAFIEKHYTVPTSDTVSTVNTGRWDVTDEGDRDRIRIALSGKVPYISTTTLEPATLNVDLFGATDVSTWITQGTNLGMIGQVSAEQIDSDIFRASIRLKDNYMWGYSIHYDNDTLVIDVRHRPERLSLKGLTIGIDAGHGGSSDGAVSTTGLKEKDINLLLALLVRDLLESRGATAVLSRTDDRDLSMQERKRIFLDRGIDLLVSIHNNASGSPIEPMGVSTYYKHIQNRQLASCLLDRMLELGIPDYGLTGNFNFALNSPTEYPNALVECLFMSSLPDEELLADPSFRKQIAEKIVAGIEDYLKIVEADVRVQKNR